NVGSLYLTRDETLRAVPSVLRGTLVGSVLGILPGGGVALSSFASYMMERKVSRGRAQFGTGAIEGVAGPEAANNAAAQTSFIPLMTLGIPANAVMALMAGALMIHGIQPGPRMVEAQPDLFWGLIASMWIGNVMLLVINLPLIGIWVRLLHVPYRLLYPAIIIFCCIGVYSLNNSLFDVYLTALFAALGVLFSKLRMEPAPLLIGLVLGPMMEEHLRRAMLLSGGDPAVFVQQPISASLLALAATALLATTLPALRRRKVETPAE
ncbi:MAG TPA: tripartite tricarboxylate transporter permease, partial [Acetobacteraceae bacterium]|nr:tripartite tricarboxylate transporter permease [Acetobacteraceae bacterium]